MVVNSYASVAAFFAIIGVAFYKMSKKYIHRSYNFTLIPVELLEDTNLSLVAIGLAAHIIYEHNLLKMHKNSELFFDRITLVKGNYLGDIAYHELVDGGYIDDFFKEGIEI